MESESIYLDYHSTTACDPRVVEVLRKALTDYYGNPSSPHQYGKKARDAIEDARQEVAEHIGALAGEIVFTSGATESNNVILQGLADSVSKDRTRILVSEVEHKSVLKAAETAAEHTRCTVERVPVTEDGTIDLKTLRRQLDKTILVVSLQAVNNELGTIQPIKKVANECQQVGALFHCDAAQALGRINIDVVEWGVDFLSLSAHKAYGPKGVGGLYLKGGQANHPISGLFSGGGQEDGLRPGTMNTPGILGFAEACRLAGADSLEEQERLRELRDAFERRILSASVPAEIVGNRADRVTTTTNIRFPDVEAEALLARLPKVALSSGAACESGAPEPSHVLQAIGLDREMAYQCVRVAFGRYSNMEDVEVSSKRIVAAVQNLRSICE